MKCQHFTCHACPEPSELLTKIEKERDEARAELYRAQATLTDDPALAEWEKRGVVDAAVIAKLREARAEARVSGRLCDLLENSRDISEKDAFAAIGKVRILERERDEARAEVERLRGLLRELRGYITPAQEQFAPVLGKIDALLNPATPLVTEGE